LGRTSNLTIERGAFFIKEEVLSEILSVAKQENPDYITFSGSGEPALNSDIGWLIREIKKEVEPKVVVLSNSSILWMPDVRADLAEADIVVPSLDAGTNEYWQRVNRPHPDLSFDEMIEGLVTFSNEFKGEIWVEILLVKGINDTSQNIDAILSILSRMHYTKVQLNTVVRPPSEKTAVALSREEMQKVAERFPEGTQIVATFQKRGKHVSAHGDRDRILAALARRPMTLKDIEQSLGIPTERAEEVLKELASEKKIKKTVHGEGIFFEVH